MVYNPATSTKNTWKPTFLTASKVFPLLGLQINASHDASTPPFSPASDSDQPKCDPEKLVDLYSRLGLIDKTGILE